MSLNYLLGRLRFPHASDEEKKVLNSVKRAVRSLFRDERRRIKELEAEVQELRNRNQVLRKEIKKLRREANEAEHDLEQLQVGEAMVKKLENIGVQILNHPATTRPQLLTYLHFMRLIKTYNELIEGSIEREKRKEGKPNEQSP